MLLGPDRGAALDVLNKANGLQLAEGGAFGAPTCQVAINFIKSRKVSANTNAPLWTRCCYK